MKKLILTLSLALGMLGASAQNAVNITLKDGTVLTAPASSVAQTEYTTRATAGETVFMDPFSVSCPDRMERNLLFGNDSLQLFTYNMSDRLRQAFQGFESLVITSTKSDYPFNAYVVGLDLSGTLPPGGTSWWANSLLDLEPVYQPVTFTFTARFAVGDVTFTKTASCTMGIRPDTQPVEDAYYVVTSANGWKPMRMHHLGPNKYDGQPFQLVIGAPFEGDQSADLQLRVVPASALQGDSFDRSLSFGVLDSVYYYNEESYHGYSLGMAAGGTDLTLNATDGADIYTLSFYPSYASLSIVCEDAANIFDRCYSNLGFENARRSADYGCDINAWDSGNTSMVRQLVNLNELTADHFLCSWGDRGIPELNTNRWTPTTPQVEGLYLRLQKGVEYCNKYLLCQGSDAQRLAEVRFLRAYYNSHLLDLFGQVPVYMDLNAVNPPSMSRQELFDYLVSELTMCVDDMADPRVLNEDDADYMRVDKAAAWMLLARLYLNAEVYTGTAQWQRAAEYAQRVVNNSGYSLYGNGTNGWSAYQKLFMGDNGSNGAACEAIMRIPYQGGDTTFPNRHAATSYGQVFLLAVFINYDMTSAFGIGQGWGGVYARPDLVRKFFPNDDAPNVMTSDMPLAAGDDRALLWGYSRSNSAADISDYYGGFAVTKYNNLYADGGTPSSPTFCDYDVFLMRYAEALLTLAEADLRMGLTADAANYINQLRQRAHASMLQSCTLQDVLDEWSREFYLEGRRRTDLIRFGQYGGNSDYLWRWKGGVYGGVSFDASRNVFPLPQSVLESNPNAVQNPGY